MNQGFGFVGADIGKDTHGNDHHPESTLSIILTRDIKRREKKMQDYN